MSVYSEFRFYSPMIDGDAVRLSMVGPHNQEYFKIIPDGGKGFRDRRNAALDEIDDAIDAGREPGEVQ